MAFLLLILKRNIVLGALFFKGGCERMNVQLQALELQLKFSLNLRMNVIQFVNLGIFHLNLLLLPFA